MQETLLNVGLACVIAAIIGGGLRAFGIEIPIINSIERQLILGCFGGALMALSFIIEHLPPDNTGETGNGASPEDPKSVDTTNINSYTFVNVEQEKVEEPRHHIIKTLHGAFLSKNNVSRLVIKYFSGVSDSDADSLVILNNGEVIGTFRSQKIELLNVCRLNDGRDAIIIHNWFGGNILSNSRYYGFYFNTSLKRFEDFLLGYGDPDPINTSEYLNCASNQDLVMPEEGTFIPCACSFEEQMASREKALGFIKNIAPIREFVLPVSKDELNNAGIPLLVRNLSLSLKDIESTVKSFDSEFISYHDIGQDGTLKVASIIYYDPSYYIEVLIVRDSYNGQTKALLESERTLNSKELQDGRLTFMTENLHWNLPQLIYTIDLHSLRLVNVQEDIEN